MSNFNLSIYLLLLSLATSVVVGEPLTGLNDDILGLIVFKSNIQDSSALNSWTEDDTSPCSWKFIRCNPSGRASELLLTGLGLSGRLGKGLVKLQQLKLLSLSHNNFSGEIPSEITQLPTLQTLDLSHNTFSGQFPSSFSFSGSSLNYIDLSHNMLTGPLSDNIFQTSSLLRYISLAGNSLEGPIPSTLSRCSVLSGLNLSNNQFSGNPFSVGLWSLTRLRLLDLSNNVFSGDVPSGIYTLHNLKELHLQGNRFSGSLPSDIGLCPHLMKLDVSDNVFTGEIPSSFGRLTELILLSLANNMLSGEFPQWIGRLTNLQHFHVSNNRLSGNIPNSVTYCTQLKTLLLRDNLVNGSVPEEIFSLGLEELQLSGNLFSGSIPPGLSRFFDSLVKLDMSRNSLTGDIPPEVGLFSKLEYLNLSFNTLHSWVPQEVWYLRNLTVLDLRESSLFGTFPEDLCRSSSSLSILQLDDNQLTGSIPRKIGNCSSLRLLSLSHNNLSGPIPSSISMLKKLEVLRIESNNLSGEIPSELGTLQDLVAVNISYNKLIGRLPPGAVFSSLDASALQGNLGLCSPLLKGPCNLNVQKPFSVDPNGFLNQVHGDNRTGPASEHHMFLSISSMIAILAAAIIVIGVVVVTLLNASSRKKLAFIDNAFERIFSGSSRSMTLSTRRLVLFGSRSSGNLLADPESLINKGAYIGEGAFGSVYKACLGNEGRTVAIKKLIMSNILQYPEDFDRGIRTLGKVKHANLVSLKGYFWTPQLQLLVSDYARNGSLQFRIHERPPNMAPLLWATRFRIMLGIAIGLAHLHHSCNPLIIHYNLKPSNILLDENYNSMISDFGLAKVLKNTSGNRFQGDPGYAAPELACQSLRVDEKCDVYSFGVILMEIVTGRRPIEYGDDNVIILNDHVRVLLEEGNVLESVDLSMGEYPDEEVLPVLKLALVCTSQVPSSRPSMSEIVKILQVIKTPVPRRHEGY